MKKIAVAFLCLGFGNLLNAQGMSVSQSILGLEVGYATVQADTDGGIFGEPDYKGEDMDIGFRIGAQNNEWRTMFVYNYYDNTDEDQNVQKAFIEFDYFFLGSDTQERPVFNPYIGINAGYMNYESTDIDENGFLYGGQAGFTIELTDALEVDMMYRYSLTEAPRTDHIGSFVFGVNYIF